MNNFIEVSSGNFDIIIDDGSHWPQHQIISFETLWKAVKPGGMYIVEDIETNWWKVNSSVYGYRITKSPNAVKKWKGVINSVNRIFTGGKSRLTVENYDVYGNIESIQFGQNIIIFYKAREGEEKFLDNDKYRFRNNL